MAQQSWRRMAWAVLALAFVLTPRYALAQQQWHLSGNAQGPRVLPAVSGLGDGRVLIVGGVKDLSAGIIADTAEIHDPATGITVLAPAPPYVAYGQAAIRLADGRALIAGGTTLTTGGIDNFATFDPVTNTWATGVMPHIAVLPAIAALPDGRILVAGGQVEETIEVLDENGDVAYTYTANVGKAADIFDPVTNTWTSASPMNERHELAAAVALSDGRILVSGGQGSQSAEIYDPATNTWTLTAPMNATDNGISTSVRLSNGRVAHIGAIASLELYDPVANTWTPAAPAPTTFAYPFGFALSGGRILLAGGILFDSNNQPLDDLATTQVYDPATGTWSAGPAMNASHALVHPASLPNGKFAIFGGYFAPNSVIEITGLNTAPVAHAGADFAASTCASCVGGVNVNGSGSSDADGDNLIYEWTIGSTVVLTSTQATGFISLPAGTHTVTLTVTDEFGESSSDTVSIVVTNVDDGYLAMIASLQAQIAALTAQQAILQAQLAACQASGGTNIAPLMNSFEQHFRTIFKDPSFELPGTTAVDELDRLLKAIKKLDKDDQRKIYRALGGRKKHNGHKGRWSSHWDDDCDYDEDDDYDKGKKK